MPRSDYSHWNEEADRIWWEEEGKHIEDPNDYYDPNDDLEWDSEQMIEESLFEKGGEER